MKHNKLAKRRKKLEVFVEKVTKRSKACLDSSQERNEMGGGGRTRNGLREAVKGRVHPSIGMNKTAHSRRETPPLDSEQEKLPQSQVTLPNRSSV